MQSPIDIMYSASAEEVVTQCCGVGNQDAQAPAHITVPPEIEC